MKTLTNLTSDSPPPKVFLDTTVLLGSFLKDGLQRQLIRFAGSTSVFIPVISRLCLLEFYTKTFSGIGPKKRIFNYTDVEFFFDEFIKPILDDHLPVNSIVGRYSIETILRENRPIGEVLVELSGCTTKQAKEIVAQQEMDEPLHQFDQNDFHIWITAIQADCRYIVTSNTHRFPAGIGSIERIHPLDFYKLISAKME